MCEFCQAWVSECASALWMFNDSFNRLQQIELWCFPAETFLGQRWCFFFLLLIIDFILVIFRFSFLPCPEHTHTCYRHRHMPTHILFYPSAFNDRQLQEAERDESNLQLVLKQTRMMWNTARWTRITIHFVVMLLIDWIIVFPFLMGTPKNPLKDPYWSPDSTLRTTDEDKRNLFMCLLRLQSYVYCSDFIFCWGG